MLHKFRRPQFEDGSAGWIEETIPIRLTALVAANYLL